MPSLLSAALSAWIVEGGEERRAFTQDPPPSAKPAIHARLRQSLDEVTDDEVHWAFRSIRSENAIAALNRVRTACTAAGLDQRVPKRKLYLLRNSGWSRGTRTREAIGSFEAAGGVTLPIEEDDLKTFTALKHLLAGRPAKLKSWLAARKPAGNTKLFRAVFGGNAGLSKDERLPPNWVDRPNIWADHCIISDNSSWPDIRHSKTRKSGPRISSQTYGDLRRIRVR
jgi:hypothetical protein